MVHQMKNLSGFSVFHCVQGAFGASSGGTPKMKNGGPREMNSKMVVVVVGPSPKKAPCPLVQAKGVVRQKSPCVLQKNTEKLGIFGPKTPFSSLCKDEGKWGFLDPETLFSRKWGFGPLSGGIPTQRAQRSRIFEISSEIENFERE